jgi:hypothetical protein
MGFFDDILGLGTKAKSTVNVISETAVNASMRTIQSCVITGSQDQTIDLGYVSGDLDLNNVRQVQTSTINLSCLQQSNKKNELLDNMSNSIVQQAEAKGQAVLSLLGSTKGEALTNIRSSLNVSINMDSIQNNIISMAQSQKIKVAYVGGNAKLTNVSQEQTMKLVLDSFQSAVANNSIVKKMAASIDQKSAAEEKNPLSFITDFFGGIANTIMLIVAFFIFLIILIVTLPMMLSSRSSQTPSQVL